MKSEDVKMGIYIKCTENYCNVPKGELRRITGIKNSLWFNVENCNGACNPEYYEIATPKEIEEWEEFIGIGKGEDKMIMCQQVKVADIQKASELIALFKKQHANLKWVRTMAKYARMDESSNRGGTHLCTLEESKEIVEFTVGIMIRNINSTITQLQNMGIDTTELEGELQ